MKEVKYTVQNGIAVLSIDRPNALNALSRNIVDQIDDAIEEIKLNNEVKVLVIYDEKNFAAGADIADMVNCNDEEARAFVFNPTFNKLEALEIPTIAIVEGYALGGGMELALACDMRVASENSKMGFPEITLGIMPGAGGTVRCARLIGLARAKEMILMGRSITAKEAEKIGLVNKVVPDGEAYDFGMNWAKRIADMSAVAVKTAKNTINEAAKKLDTVDGIAIESENWAMLFNTEDQKEGMRAFLEKRKPVFQDK